MLGIILLSVFVIIVGLIIFFEIRSERKYQAKRKEQQQNTYKRTSKKPPNDSPRSTKQKNPIPVQPKEIIVPKEEIKQKEVVKPKKEKLQLSYPKFTHQRLLEMGLEDDEAKEFVQELIPQLETQIPLIEETLALSDFEQLERLTHSIKGSASNIGTGGVSDLLAEYNTYLKQGTDIEIARSYLEYLKHYTQELKVQYI